MYLKNSECQITKLTSATLTLLLNHMTALKVLKNDDASAVADEVLQ